MLLSIIFKEPVTPKSAGPKKVATFEIYGVYELVFTCLSFIVVVVLVVWFFILKYSNTMF